MNDIVVREDVNLPALPNTVLPAIAELTAALGIPRNVLASQEEIEYAWRDLPRELREIPADLRGELVARMCVAVSTGLFDGAMNYIWNAAILQLRQKIRNFGLAVVAQIQQSDFEEKNLVELQDSRLLDLCLKLNIVNEDGFFFLDQCRDVRNNFSAAHPTMGTVNDREFTTFLNRCVRYALADSASPRGVDIGAFISAVKGPRFNDHQCQIWIQRLTETHDAQRQMLVNMVHGVYCDPATAEPARLNALDICSGLSENFTASIKSDLINSHSEYVAKGIEDKHTASLQFFEKLGLLGLLNESEQHVVFSRAIDRLWNVHNGMNNFYNEPPFAERLLEVSQQGAIPETIQDHFVQTVVSCRIGNGYGVSNAAEHYYNEIIQGFSPREVATLIRSATNRNSTIGRRVTNNGSCRRNLKAVLELIDSASIPSGVKADYDRLVR
ncbi:hypothetical protein NH514_20180 [Pseudoalteromonas sp. ACER1]|uniref:hypothetical protein n=1 Tax=unclassified Pseudoalteromonas TaxID=194690 RepID=UPI001F47CD9E|nr:MULTISPECIES: hypothetical protein [unclassified Pseudoalteromonas]MCF2849447.1 hypothetical protein [Pseudoalteromonas sp. PAST1]MCO7213009.1 hypothetical protein [Pseudoalteromonas sp. ACER1]